MAEAVLRVLRQSIEANFADRVALDGLEAVAEVADLEGDEREIALGIIDSFRADLEREDQAELLARAEDDPEFEFELPEPEGDPLEEGLVGIARAAFSRLHPRNRVGEFRDTPGEHKLNPGLDLFKPKRRPLVLGKSMAWRRAKLRPEFVKVRGIHGDEFMYELAQDIGYSGRPTKGTEADVARAIEQGATPLWRGLTDASYAEHLLTGSYYAGQGFRGNGIYTSTSRRTAVAYAVAPPNKGIVEKADHSVVLHIALHPEARIADYKAIAAEREREMKRLKEVMLDKSRPERERIEARILYYIALDAGRYAMTQGYDAIRVKEDEINVLNRTALLVSTEFQDAGENVVKALRRPPGAE